jgi:trans-2,3-dihydro-3-hydroxyanthranilate isomerase
VPVAPEATYRARIFTPETELPFAGHPSVGAAVTLTRRDGRPPGRVVQECGAGLLPIEVYDGGKARLSGGTPTVGPELDPAPLLACASLEADDYAGPPPRLAGCGLEFPFLSVKADAVRRASGDAAAARRFGFPMVSVLHWDAATASAHARVFCPGVAVPEDPATGSAALGLGVWLVESGLLGGSGDFSYHVRQGVEMLRPSTLECTVTAASGQVVSATVAGHVVAVASGRIAAPPFVG